MGSLLNNPALIQYKDSICANHRFQAVGNYNNGSALNKATDRLLNLCFIFGIKGRRRLVKQDDRGIFQDSPCNGYSLFFTTGKSRTALTDHCVKAIRHLHNEVIAVGKTSGIFNFFLCGILFSVANIIGNGILEQIHVLKDHRNIFHQLFRLYILFIDTA